MANVGTNPLLAKVLQRGQQAWEKNKTNDINWGMQNIPAGIVGGIAQVEKVVIQEYKSGAHGPRKDPRTGADIPADLHVLFRVIVKEPHEFKNVRCFGQGINVTIPLCDTPEKTRKDGTYKTFEDNLADLINEFQKLGINTKNFQMTQLETICQALTKSRPHTRFSSRGWTPPANAQNSKPDEMVFYSLDGACLPPTSFLPPQMGMKDKTPQVNGQAATPPQSPPRLPVATAQAAPEPEPEVETPYATGPADEMPDGVGEGSIDFNTIGLDELVQYCDLEGAEGDLARAEINSRANAVGIETSVVENAETFAAVAEMIRQAEAPAEKGSVEETVEEETVEEVIEEEAAWKPEPDQEYGYQPLDPATKKPALNKAKKPLIVLVRVTSVDETAQTLNLREVNGKRLWKNVKWDALKDAP